jgi:diaminohydroxyphosphoribosylaminopyrimidine deaminase/5-amino-6-(5-phosphoribosylamino)uracil reductase
VADACWSALRLLRNCVRTQVRPFRYVSMRIGDPAVAIDRRIESAAGSFGVTVVCDSDASVLTPASETVLRVSDLVHVEVAQRGAAPDSALALLRLYLPYCLAPVAAQRLGRAVSVCHFAQTLDGRIATASGDSHWIGCDENLVHAHRMRALCDAVLIGAGTLRRDRPRLNVRRVEGDDPVRIVIGSGDLDLASLTHASSAPVITIGGTLPIAPRNGRIHGEDIMTALFASGVRSVLVEGGCSTTSALLEDGAVDIVQLHIEPLLLGPGVSSFDRTPPQRIADAMTFRRHEFFPVGRGMMFVGAR